MWVNINNKIIKYVCVCVWAGVKIDFPNILNHCQNEIFELWNPVLEFLSFPGYAIHKNFFILYIF